MDNIEAVLEKYVEETQQGCGQVYELYAERFTGKVDGYISTIQDQDQVDKIKKAAEYHGYYDVNEADEFEDDDDYCVHHLPYDCCPCGCGDLERN